MTGGLFVTGTDTGVGKTRVAAALVRSLVKEGLRVGVMKPVAAGSETPAPELQHADALALIAASNIELPYAWVNPYCLESAIAPHIAAREQGVRIDISLIAQCYTRIAALSDHVVVEGAGGWQVPINEHQTLANVATALGLPVLLVVGLRLGCLNHALLTRDAIEAHGAPFAGWIASTIDPAMARIPENLTTLESLLEQPPLAVLPYLPEETPLTLGEAARRLMGGCPGLRCKDLRDEARNGAIG